jgi:hypothetical protein
MSHLVTLRFALSFLALTMCVGISSQVEAEDLSANQIVENMLKRGLLGLDEAEATVRMVLVDASGARTERVMENLRRRKNGQLQGLTRFRAPADVAGCAFLQLERDKGESEQYIYLPAYKKVRRIVRSDRDGSFMGSDFTYADMERRDTRQADHKRLPDEDVGGVKAYVLESVPTKDAGSTYSKIETWVRQDNFLPLRVRFYDKAGKLLKTLYTKRFKTVDGQPVIVETQMVNKQSGHSTEMVVDTLKARKDLPDTAFTPTALEHG